MGNILAVTPALWRQLATVDGVLAPSAASKGLPQVRAAANALRGAGNGASAPRPPLAKVRFPKERTCLSPRELSTRSRRTISTPSLDRRSLAPCARFHRQFIRRLYAFVPSEGIALQMPLTPHLSLNQVYKDITNVDKFNASFKLCLDSYPWSEANGCTLTSPRCSPV